MSMWQFTPGAEKRPRSCETQRPGKERPDLLFDALRIRAVSIIGCRIVQPKNQWCRNMVDPFEFNIQRAQFCFFHVPDSI